MSVFNAFASLHNKDTKIFGIIVVIIKKQIGSFKIRLIQPKNQGFNKN